MLELGHKEKHLLSGIGIQLLLIGLLVFVYTQAFRQMNARHDLYLKMKEQVAHAKAQLAKQAAPDLARVQADLLNEMPFYLATPDILAEWSKRLETVARDQFDFRHVEVTVGNAPEKVVSFPTAGRPPVEVHLYPFELKGEATTRDAARFLKAIQNYQMKVLAPLSSLQIEAADTEQVKPVVLHLKWLVATAPKTDDQKTTPRFEPILPQGQMQAATSTPSEPSLDWGARDEPFRG